MIIHIARDGKKMKLHAASGVAITCYCWHEQHMCNLQAGRDSTKSPGRYALYELWLAHKALMDVDSKATRV